MKFGLVVALTITAVGLWVAASERSYADGRANVLVITGAVAAISAVCLVVVPAVAAGARDLGREWQTLARNWIENHR